MATLNLTRKDLNLTTKDVRTIKRALRQLAGMPGAGDMGSRAPVILERYERGVTDVSLPEWNTIGLALSRLDTRNGYRLLNKITAEITAYTA